MSLRISRGEQVEYELAMPSVLEIGRQDEGEPEPYAFVPATGENVARCICAHANERENVSRRHLLLETLGDDKVRLTNRSKTRLAVQRPQSLELAPKEDQVLALPLKVTLAGRVLEISRPGLAHEAGLESLAQPTLHLATLGETSVRLRPLPATIASENMDELVNWLQTAMEVLQASVGSADFLRRAVEALVKIVGLDSGRVLLLEGETWRTATAHPLPEAQRADWKPSSRVLEHMRREKRTYVERPAHTPLTPRQPSLRGIYTVVAAPLLDAKSAVVGALYGERWRPLPTQPSGKVEALLVDILACGVATGLARLEEETAKVRGRVQFEQFFGPELTQQLELYPDMLKDREAEVTLLFCDVRGFSRISERLAPADTMSWMSDVLSELSEKALQAGGVLIDYIGDEILVMFGAPREQEDQAYRAVKAALTMSAALPQLNERWRGLLQEDRMDIGIGINTGLAQVGNSGSRYKFKFGPLGNTVNLASRVQGMTKYLRCRVLVTEATYRRLPPASASGRRVIQTRVANITKAVNLYEVEPPGDEGRVLFFRQSEEALGHLEAGEFARAARLAGALLHEHPGDNPMLLVLARAVDQLMNPMKPFDPVWDPPGK
jgi:adenylate cyclase